MPSSWVKTLIIVVMLLSGPLLTGCSALRLGYGNGPQLAWWWLDGYVDFSSEQAPAAKDRPSPLVRLAPQPPSCPNYTPRCWPARRRRCWSPSRRRRPAAGRTARSRLDPAIDRAVTEFADLVPGLGEAQFKHLEQRYAKATPRCATTSCSPTRPTRLKESVKRAVERAEQLLYGSWTRRSSSSSRRREALTLRPRAWLAERQRRQRDTLQTLRRLVAEKADRDTRVAAHCARWPSAPSAHPTRPTAPTRSSWPTTTAPGGADCTTPPRRHSARRRARRSRAGRTTCARSWRRLQG
jgi:hypothetical protein